MTHRQEIVDEVHRMKDEDMSNAQIAAACGISENTVQWLCHRHRFRRATRGAALYLSEPLLQLYRAEAARRGVEYGLFMRKLLNTIARDNLFSAIIDDGK